MSETAEPKTVKAGWWRRASGWKRFQVVALVILVAGHVGLQQLYLDWMLEDAAITFTFARNLADGEGLVAYPGGERVEGYSNPSWTFLIALGEVLGVDGFTSSKVLGGVFGAATVLLGWAIARRIREEDDVVPLLAGLLLAINPQFVIWAASGLENSIFGFFLALGTWCVLREFRGTGFPWSSVAFFGLSISRPEGILYAAIGGFWAMVFTLHAGRGAAPTLKWLAGFFVPFGVYHAVRIEYFAWEFPNTYYSKIGRVGYDPANYESNGWKYLRRWADELYQGWFLPVYVLSMTGLEAAATWTVRGRRIAVPSAVPLLLLLGWALLVPGPEVLTKTSWWPELPTLDWWNERRIWLLAAVAILALVSAIGRRGWQGLVLNWSLLLCGLYFTLHASGDWAKGFRWLSLVTVPQSVLFAMGIAEIGDAFARRFPPRGPVFGWVWGLSRAWNRSWSLPAGVAAALLFGLAIPPAWMYLDLYSHKNETSPWRVQRRVNYMHYVQHRLHLDHVVNLDVDMGATMWWSGHEIVDIAGLVDVPMGHHKYQAEFIREYVFGERRPHFAHLHGGWESKMGVKKLPEYERTYFEIPGYPTGQTSVHVGNRVRTDLLLEREWHGQAGRRIEYPDGIVVHGVDVPLGEATPGRALYVEIGWSATGVTDDPGFRTLAFVRQGDLVKTWDMAPGYDWFTVDRWKALDVVYGRYSLDLPKDLPKGVYDFGIVVFGRDGAVAMPVSLPPGAQGGAGDPNPAFALGEVRWSGAVEVLSEEDDDERLRTQWDSLATDASEGRCEGAEERWEWLRYRRSDDWRWQESNRPKIARLIGQCWVGRAADQTERDAKVDHLARARWWDHWTPGLEEAADPVADLLFAEGKVALEQGDWETAYRRFTDVLRIDATRSWARRYAETARDKRLGIDEESVAAKEADKAARRIERRKPASDDARAAEEGGE